MVKAQTQLRRFSMLFMFLMMAGVALQSMSAQEDQSSKDWVNLFNGTDLEGWTQKNGTATYEVEEGGIICGTTKKGSPNSFLCTDKEYGDFELTFEVKVDDRLNSGVQIRSRTKELNAKQKATQKFGRVFGPQVEIEASGSNGAEAGYVYGEATGRGWLTPAERLKPRNVFRDGEWNTYRIVAQGPRIQTWINGEEIEDLTDEAIFQSHPAGFIGLQVHGIGQNQGPFQVRWRNLKIREIPTETKHSFIGAGRAAGIVIVNEQSEVEWKLELPASDVWVLESGNILTAIYPCKDYPKGGVAEIDRESKSTVWSYQGQQKEISTVQKIADNEYLVAELGDTPRAIVINRDGKILREMPLRCQVGNAHMQTRMLRMLPNGNYIAPHLLDFAVKEYDPKTGKVLNTFPTDDRGREKRDWPFTAIRLDNGNTLIGCTNGNRVIEVDDQGAIVWSVDNEDLGEALIDDACGIQRLPNGNTVITSYHANGDRVKLLEVTREKKLVWKFNGLKSGLHHFQVLTTNGQPIQKAMK